MRVATARAAAIAGILGLSVSPAFSLTIDPSFDSSITALPNAAIVEQAFDQAANSFSSMFSNPVTVNIDVSWGSVGGQTLSPDALSESSTSLYGYFSYNQIKSWLTASASTAADREAYATLPAIAPAGESRFVLTTAQAKALGLVAPVGGLDGSVGFSGPLSAYDFDRSDGISPGQYDFIGAAEHEISEILGRISGLSSSNPDYATAYDLFRFSDTGTRSFSYDGSAYFSVDGGVTDLGNFNASSSEGDRGDWLTTSLTNDAADAFARPGVENLFSGVDQTALDVIGWGGAGIGAGSSVVLSANKAVVSIPEPAGLALFGVGLLALAALRLFRSSAVAACRPALAVAARRSRRGGQARN